MKSACATRRRAAGECRGVFQVGARRPAAASGDVREKGARAGEITLRDAAIRSTFSARGIAQLQQYFACFGLGNSDYGGNYQRVGRLVRSLVRARPPHTTLRPKCHSPPRRAVWFIFAPVPTHARRSMSDSRRLAVSGLCRVAKATVAAAATRRRRSPRCVRATRCHPLRRVLIGCGRLRACV